MVVDCLFWEIALSGLFRGLSGLHMSTSLSPERTSATARGIINAKILRPDVLTCVAFA